MAVGGSASVSHTMYSEESDYWTKLQHKAEQALGGWLGKYDLSKGVKPYEGRLPGTYTPESLSSLFRGASTYAQGKPFYTVDPTDPTKKVPIEGAQLFKHYQQYSNPEERDKRIAERLEARRKLLAPEREKEDSLLRAKMKSMGLQHSSDMLKKQADIEATRQAEEDLITSDLLDRYEAMGYQAGQDAMAAIQGIGTQHYQIQTAGDSARFQEWIRTQPEYSPLIDVFMAYLGLQGVSSTKGTSTTISGSVSGGM